MKFLRRRNLYFYMCILLSCDGIIVATTGLQQPSMCSIVTGANGYLGRAVVHELLQRDGDQDIYCLVRPQRVPEEELYWAQCQQQYSSKHNDCVIVRVLPYDMLDGGISFGKALETITHYPPQTRRFVYHIASVFGPTSDHRQTAIDNVQGTVDLVYALAKAKSSTIDSSNWKLILTSSMAAVRGTGQIPQNTKFYTSQDWNNVSRLGVSWGESYQWSKTESEKQAWELTKRFDIPMVALCPSFVFGPRTSTTTSSYSLQLVQQWLNGKSPVQSRLCVDVRDCAKAHVEAGLREHIQGRRYIVSTESRVSSQRIAALLQDICRQRALSAESDQIYYDPVFVGGAIAIGDKEVESTQLLKEDLGVTLRSVENTILDMVETF